jgi:glyoxylate/hydroxypyruvate reductase
MSEPLRIALCCTDTRAGPWLEGFKAALPGCEIADWLEGQHLPFQAQYAVVWAPPAALFAQQTQLQALFNIGAGVDAILKNPHVPPHLPIVRLDDAGMSEQMAEYVCHYVIRAFRDLGDYAQAQAKAEWAYKKPRRRAAFTVGIMGMGVLGQRVAQAVRQFGFPVAGWSQSPKQLEGIRTYTGEPEFRAFLSQCQVLVCLLPLTPHTQGIINAAHLACLPQGAHVINVARGGHVVDADLLAALDSGHVAGATLDVFHEEPLPPTHPFWRHPKVTVTPHTSARTMRDESIAQIAHKMLAMQRGEAVVGVVQRGRGY